VPRAAKTPTEHTAPSAGLLLESRVARLWFWNGYFARYGIDLKRIYDPEPLQITDLDLLAYQLGPDLASRRLIGETKGGTGKSAPRPLDRVVWLTGLIRLVEADAAELTTALHASERVRDLASRMGVSVQTVADLERRELQAGIPDLGDVGPLGTRGVHAVLAAQRGAKSDPVVARAFAYLRGDGYLIDPALGIKRTIALLSIIARRWTPRVDDADQRTVSWLLAEAVVLFCLQAVRLSAPAVRWDPQAFGRMIAERLSEGALAAADLRQLSEAIDSYLIGVLRRGGAPEHVIAESLGAFAPQPPAYTAPLVETLRRLAARPDVARDLPRYADLVVHERLVHGGEPSASALRRVTVDPDSASRLLRTVLAFLRGQADLPADLATKLIEGSSGASADEDGGKLTLGLAEADTDERRSEPEGTSKTVDNAT